MPASRLVLLAGLFLALLALPGARCGARSFQGIALQTPLDETLLDDPSPQVSVAGLVAKNFIVATVDVWLDGVPLAASLGLTPPFSDESGVVVVASGPVTLSDFDIQGIDPRRVRVQLDGLALGSHRIEVQGSTGAVTKIDGADIHLIGPMTLEAESFAAAGLPFGPASGGAEGELANATLGQAAAEGSISFSSGDELRAGFVPIAEAIIMGSAP